MARKGGNPGTYFKAEGCDEKVSKATIAVRLPQNMDAYIRNLPNRAEWLRTAIAAQIEKDKNEEESGIFSTPC